MIQNLSAINTNTPEGRFLMAAIAKITTESQTDKTPDEVVGQLSELVDRMYEDADPIEEMGTSEKLPFERQLSILINKNSRENESNTPDFLLAEYLQDCLVVFEKTVNGREKWYGRENKHSELPKIG